MNKSKKSVCEICKNKEADYTCPKCYINYCSLACYQSCDHSLCTESFYRESCLAAFNEMKRLDCDSKEVIIDELKLKISSSNNFDNYETLDLADRLNSLGLESRDPSTEEIWNVLTKKERKKFLRSIESGSISSLIPIYDPWWRKKVLPFDDSSMKPRHQLSTIFISDKLPHKSVTYALCDVLLSYIYCVILYNGEFISDVLEDVSQHFIELSSSFNLPASKTLTKSNNSKILDCNRYIFKEPCPIYENFDEVLAKFSSRLSLLKLPCSQTVINSLVLDLFRIISLNDACKYALFQCSLLLTKFKAIRPNHFLLKNAINKTEFLLSCSFIEDKKAKIWWDQNVVCCLIPQVSFKMIELQSVLNNLNEEKSIQQINDGKKIPNFRNIINYPKRSSENLIQMI